MGMMLRRHRAVENTAGAEIKQEIPVKEYKKTEVMRMSTDDLKALALEIGIEITDESTGKVLKEQIVAKLGL